ncbi:unnamed protein product [Didymodactylos carnosus]|uniref:Uncharacterized protein n=1 Tax=Didymodactylos carnosus TaxID=1234261 RepID=A0A8S2NKN2_9BILA|nr:unnamed protein product [Didymodactylos carnosus]CAF4006567.1 unnamed protein product [Didymodactylos carnosus]
MAFDLRSVITRMPDLYTYNGLINQIKAIKYQVVTVENLINNRLKNETKNQNQLKFRSLTFLDPYGNQIVNKHMDHELINKIVKIYKKDYVPKYLQRWIHIGHIDHDQISSINESELISTVSECISSHQFIAYGRVTVWLGSYDNPTFKKYVLAVVLIDNMEKIKRQMARLERFMCMELKSCILNNRDELNERDWNEGKVVKWEDTILSSGLYQDNCVLMAKIGNEKIRHVLAFKFKDIKNVHQLSSATLQESIVQAQAILSALYRKATTIYTAADIPKLTEIIMLTDAPNGNDDDKNNSDDNDVSHDQ